MKRIAWATDIHLNFCRPEQIERFCRDLLRPEPDAVFLAGDIGEAPTLEGYLLTLERLLDRPIYFVLGNHDFYRDSIAAVRGRIVELSRRSRWLRWLTVDDLVELTPETALIGHDSWADGRLGSGARSTVDLSDYVLIRDFRDLTRPERFAKLAALGDEATQVVRERLSRAVQRFPNVILLTHVPPFREACWHEGRISEDDYLPHFACKAMGDALRAAMEAHPECLLTVLCGHTHGAGQVEILPNLRVWTGGADYGRPAVQRTIDVP